MKSGKIYNKSRILKVLLGLTVAGALLFASCQNIFDLAEQKTQDDGYGYVVVNLGDAEGRTIRPNIDPTNVDDGDSTNTKPYEFANFIYKFIGVGTDGKDLEITNTWDTSLASNAPAFLLPAGTYRLVVTGYSKITDTISGVAVNRKSVEGEYQGLVITGGGTKTISVALKPVDLKDFGTLRIELTTLANPQLIVTLQQYVEDGDKLFDNISYITLSLSSGVYAATVPNLPPGTYQLTGKINWADGKYAGFSEAVHIVPNIQTRYIDDFTGDKVATVSGPEEAIQILKNEILEWVNPSNINKAVLASTPIDLTSVPDTIVINYIGSAMPANLAFPITPQLGWAATTSWTVENTSSPTTITLTNNNVQTGSSPATYVTYKVQLNPVAQFEVSYAANAVPGENGRGITIAGVTLSETIKGKGIGPLTATTITVKNGAVTINGGFAALDANDVVTSFPLPDTNTVAKSQVYRIVVYQKVGDQIRDAFAELERDIASIWIDDKTWLANDFQPLFEDKKDKDFKPVVGSAPGDGINDTVTLYYVESRLAAAASSADPKILSFTVPKNTDDRWDFLGNWNVTNGATTSDVVIDTTTPANNKNPDNKKAIGFTPKGGDRVTYDVILKPVAEFYVDFNPDTYNTVTAGQSGYNASWNDDTDQKIVTDGGKVSVATVGSTTSLVDFDRTNNKFSNSGKGGKNFLLGNQTITLTNVTIMTDEATQTTGSYGSNIINVYKSSLTGTPAFADIVQPNNGSPYTLTAATSREYTIWVYRSLAEQRKAAVEQLQAEDDKDHIVRWGVPTEAFRKVDVITTPPVGSNPYSSNVYYVSTTVPTLVFPVSTSPGVTPSYDTPYTADKGWDNTNTTNIANAANVGDYNNKPVAIKLNFKGGLADTVYQFNLIGAAEYKIIFGKTPRGGNTTGSVAVTGLNPGNVGGAITNKPHKHDDADIGSYFLIASGTGQSNAVATIVIGSPADQNIVSYDDGSNITYSTGSTTTVTVGTSGGTTSRRYEFTVYPKKETQIAEVLDALKRVESLNTWGSNVSSTEGFEVQTSQASANTTKFNVVGNLTANALSPPNPAFLVNPYDIPVTNITGSAADAKGQTTITVKFEPLGKSGSSPVVNVDSLEYKFELTAVAKYIVNFLPGPASTTMGDANSAKGDIQIKTYDPAGTILKAQPGISHNSRNVFVGGIGITGSEISSTQGNVFSVKDEVGTTLNGTLVDGALLGSDGAAAVAGKQALGAITSQNYTINVYPSIADQKKQVSDKLATIRTNATFFDTTSASKPDLRSNITPITGNISEIWYLGTNAPSINKPDNFLYAGTAAGVVLDYQSKFTMGAATGADATTGVAERPVNFTAYGDSAASLVYKMRVIPVVEYTVIYSPSARGKVIITPPATASNTTAPDGKIEVFSSTSTPGIAGRGSTKIQIDADSGQYKTVTIYKGDVPISDVILPNAVNQFVTITPDSAKYTIQVFNE